MNFCLVYKRFKLQERPLIKRGAEGANPEEVGTKLSGKRTVTSLNPGKIQPFDFCSRRDTEGDKFRFLRDNLSG